MFLTKQDLTKLCDYGPKNFAAFVDCPVENIEFELNGFYIEDTNIVVNGKVRFKTEDNLCWRRSKRILSNKDSQGWYVFSAKMDNTLKIF